MAPQSIGETVTVRGDQFQVTDVNNVSHLGSKFFGKMSFDLVKVADGSKWGYCGKRVTVNAKLSPVVVYGDAEPEQAEATPTGPLWFRQYTYTSGTVDVRVNVTARIADAGDAVHVGDVEGGQYRTLCDEYADHPYFVATGNGVTCSACLAYVAEWLGFYAGRNAERDRTPIAQPAGPAEQVAEATPDAEQVAEAEPEAVACAELARRVADSFGVAGTSAAATVSARYHTPTGAVTITGRKGDADTVAAVFGRPYRFDMGYTPTDGGYCARYVPARPVASAEREQVAEQAAPDDVTGGAEIMARAVDAYAAGDVAGALAAVADGETLAPDYREPGASGTSHGWADLRASLPAQPEAGAVPVGQAVPVAEPEAVAEPVADVVQLTTDGGTDAFPVDTPSVADRPAVPVAAEPEAEQGQLFACADTRKAARANFGDLGMIDGLGNIAPDAVAEPTPTEPTPTPEAEPVDPFAGLDTVDSDALAVALSVMADVDPDDADMLNAIGDACDRVQQREQDRIGELTSRGWPLADAVAEVTHADPAQLEREEIRARVDADRRAGESRGQAVRREYDAAVAGWFVEAETACRGHLLTADGESRGIDPRSLWSGPAWRVERYASEELRGWFAEHGRVTVADWREQCGTVPRPVSAPPAPVAEVPETAAEVVAAWEADDMPAPVSPAAPTVPAGQVAEPEGVPLVIAGNVARVGYRPGTAVRSVLKQVRPEVLRRTRDTELKTARCSIVPDREAREVSVTLEGAEGADVARVWVIVAEVMAAHGFHALADAVPVGA